MVLLDHGLYRQLNPAFIKDYANFWIALLNLNEKQLEKYTFQMFRHDERTNGNQIDYHRLFASMISGRSWDALFQDKVFHSPDRYWITSTLGLSGIANPRTRSEKMTMQRKAGTASFLAAIMLILQKCPRELLLVMKTNDLVRSIDLVLGGGQDQSHLIRNASQIGWSCLNHVITSFERDQLLCKQGDIGKDELKDYIFLFLKLVLLKAFLLL